jgi:hypothetical protein
MIPLQLVSSRDQPLESITRSTSCTKILSITIGRVTRHAMKQVVIGWVTVSRNLSIKDPHPSSAPRFLLHRTWTSRQYDQIHHTLPLGVACAGSLPLGQRMTNCGTEQGCNVSMLALRSMYAVNFMRRHGRLSYIGCRQR